MQPKAYAYVPAVAVLLTALLAGCTGSDGTDATDDPRPGGTSSTATAAEPGRYRTLPEPCGVVSRDTLATLLPGVKLVTDAEQREIAYAGEPTLTYDTDRRVGCRWKVESTTATDYLFVDFERVVSYDSTVSDDSRAEEIYGRKEAAADLPEPADSTTGDESGDETADESGDGSGGGTGTASPSASPSTSAGSGSASPSVSPSATGTPASLQPRALDDLGDEAFLDDELSTAQQRTVTVVFRTSNVIVTVEYAEQPATTTDVPDSEEMQDRALSLAGQLVESFND
ncbi:DUF3558 domain-containing protein [Streptomyces sp. NPDC002845]